MKIIVVNVLVQFVVKDSTEDKRLALVDLAENYHEKSDEPVYEATNEVVNHVLANAKKLEIPIRDTGVLTPVDDFSIHVEFQAIEKK